MEAVNESRSNMPHTNTSAIRTVPELIDRFGGNAALAALMGIGPSTVSEWRRTGRIHFRHWPAIVALAEQLSLRAKEEGEAERSRMWAGVTADTLLAMMQFGDEESAA
jgi:DNA-binding transcriptional regulator YdaS (Cro superfamily)